MKTSDRNCIHLPAASEWESTRLYSTRAPSRPGKIEIAKTNQEVKEGDFFFEVVLRAGIREEDFPGVLALPKNVSV